MPGLDRVAITKAEAYLRTADPVLGAVIARQTIEEPPRRGDYYASLARTVIGQQISVASARATAARFEAATGFDPSRALAVLTLPGTDETNLDDAKTIGLSRQKANYIRDLSAHFVHNPGVYGNLDTLSDAAVIDELVKVKGIGVWSAQMFLLFTLGRPDVFAPLDIGVQNAMINVYGLQKPLDLTRLEGIAKKWSPYRSVALLHLWQSLYKDPLVVD